VNISASSSPSLNLPVVLRALRGAVGGWCGLGLLGSALGLLLYGRLGDICGKMERLSQRFRDGRLWRVASRAVAAPRVAADGRRAGTAWVWPGRFGWLVRAAAYRAAVYGAQLREILGRPEMVELLIAAPQAGRILRPVCRMLAVETSLLRPRMEAPARSEGEAAGIGVVSPGVEVVRKKVRAPRVKVDYGRIPLPRGVTSWAQRERALERARALVRGES
jgi:hypothetical protein